MTNQEINEYLAEHLFGLKKGVDFGIMPEHKLKLINYTGLFSKCLNCKREKYTKNFADIECYKKPIDYINNYQQVLEKLAKDNINFEIAIKQDNHFLNNYGFAVKMIDTGSIRNGIGCGDTIGEALCIAAIEYLKGDIK